MSWLQQRRMDRQRGLSLLELLIGMALGLLVIAGVLQIFASSKNAYRMQTASSRVQESGRFALEIMKPDLRAGGGLDFCIAEVPLNSLLDTGGTGYDEVLFDPSISVVAWEYVGTGATQTYNLAAPAAAGAGSAAEWKSLSTSGAPATNLPAAIARLAIKGSDVLLVKSAEQLRGVNGCNSNDPSQASVVTNYGAACPSGTPAAPISEAEMCDLAPQDSLVLVTDCAGNADLFQRRSACTSSSIARGSGGDPGNNGANWSTAYNDTSQFYAVRSIAYFVGVDNATGEPALYEFDFGSEGSAAAATQLVAGVESMQVQLAELLPTGVLQYEEGNDIDDPRRVLGINVSLLVRSPRLADTETDDQTYSLSGVTINPIDDNRLRRVFSTTTGVRNRIVVN